MYNKPTMQKFPALRLTRRRALKSLGLGAAATAVLRDAFAQQPAFPKGAIIRTILRDYAPEELAGGATLFHEHMQLAPGFHREICGSRGRRSSREWFAAGPSRARP